MKRGITTIVLGALLSVLLAQTQASAHIEDHGQWFTGGYTVHTDGEGRIDPLNVIFKGSDNGDVLTVPATEMLSKWDSDRRGNLADQGEPGCLSDQGIYYQHPKQLDAYQDSNQKSGCYESAWHVRLWDSKEHDDASHPDNHDPQRDTWAIMGVHYDSCCVHGLNIGDKVGKPWEVAARGMIKELSEYCSDPNWRHLPASGPVKFQGRFSDGILSRVSPEENGPGHCG